MNQTRVLRRRQRWTTVLVPILLLVPFTGPYEQHADLLARCLYAGALLLAVAAFGLLLAPVTSWTCALLSRGATILRGATALTALLVVDLALSGLLGPPLTG